MGIPITSDKEESEPRLRKKADKDGLQPRSRDDGGRDQELDEAVIL